MARQGVQRLAGCSRPGIDRTPILRRKDGTATGTGSITATTLICSGARSKIDGLDYILDIERLNPKAGETRWTEQTVELIRGLEKVLGHGSLLAYLIHMTLRIVEIHRALKPTGSFYLHCDPTASHYLKLVLDAVFCGQGGDFRNEIVWRSTGSHNKAKRFGPVHDAILFYTKSLQFTFNPIYRPYLKGHVDGYFKKSDENGKYWTNSESIFLHTHNLP